MKNYYLNKTFTDYILIYLFIFFFRMKFQLLCIVALVAFASANPVPEEQNLAAQTLQAETVKEITPEIKADLPAEVVQPEIKTAVIEEKPAVLPAVEEKKDEERKLDAAPEIKAEAPLKTEEPAKIEEPTKAEEPKIAEVVAAKPAEEPKTIVEAVKATEEVKLAEPVKAEAESTRLVRETEAEVKKEETLPAVVAEEPKKIEEPAPKAVVAEINAAVVPADSKISAEPQVQELAQPEIKALPVAEAPIAVAEEKLKEAVAVVEPIVKNLGEKFADKSADKSDESKESEEQKDESKESGESDEKSA